MKKKIFIAFVIFIVVSTVLARPKLDRDWTNDQQVLPVVALADDSVSIKNIRNISYSTTKDYETAYYDANYKLDDLESAWFLVEPFGAFGAAHTLVSFGFSDGRYLSVSVEIRKEKGESFSPIKGLLRQYELVYVIADESDVIKLRTNYRKDEVRLYPIKASKEKIRAVFVDMLRRADKLSKESEFYNTIGNNCTTNIVKHVRKFSDKDIPWYDLRYLMPANVDEIVYDAGLIDTDLSFDEVREKFFITERAQDCGDEDFSRCIRDFD